MHENIRLVVTGTMAVAPEDRDRFAALVKSEVMQAAFAEVATLRILARDVDAYQVTGRNKL